MWVVIFVLLLIWLWLVSWKKEDSRPVLSGRLPLIGHLHKLLGGGERLYKLLFELSEECEKAGGVICIFFGRQKHIVIVDPEDALTAANGSIEKHHMYRLIEPWLGNGLIPSKGITWKTNKKLLGPAFGLNRILGYLSLFNKQTNDVVKQLQSKVDEGPFDVTPYMAQLSLKNICSTNFGVKVDDENEYYKTYINACEKIIEMVTRKFQNVWLQIDFIYKLSGLKNKENELIKTAHNFTDTLMKTKKLRNEIKTIESDTTDKSFLHFLLKLSDNELITEKNVREQIDTTTVAGFDTISWSLTYVLLVLGSNPEVQEKVVTEIKEVFGQNERDLDKDDLVKLVYTEAVIKEAIRLYNITPIIGRHMTEEVRLKNYTLYPGEECLIPVCGVNRHKIWGPDANKFRPERWLEKNNSKHLSAFSTFGIGRRSCIGKTFALISMKTAIVHILRNYKVKSDLANLKLKCDFIIKPVSGHLITIKRRKK